MCTFVCIVCCAGIVDSDTKTTSAVSAATASISSAAVSTTNAASAAVHPKLLSSEIYTSPQSAALRYLVIDIYYANKL